MMTRSKFVLVQLAGLATICTLGYMSYSSFKQYNTMAEQLRQSVQLQDTVLELDSQKWNRETLDWLQEVRKDLSPAQRMELLSSVIQSYTERNPRLLSSRSQVFVKNEKEFRKFITPQLQYFSQKTIYFALLAGGAFLFEIALLWLILTTNILNPIQWLSRRMSDFLHNRYTYQFTIPAQNEVGHLQATFNAMAQRVLTNMEELKNLDNAKSEFLSIASHELRTPLTSIKGSLSLMNSGIAGKMNEPTQNLLNIALMETDRLIRLINDLLDLAKIEAQKLTYNKDWIPLKGLVEQTLHSLNGLALTSGVRLEAKGLPSIEIHVDRDRIHQVLTNLLSNAIKYSPKGGVVTVRCDVLENDNIEIQVIDQGKGIAPEDQELIFQKFRQATSPKNPLVKGTGLGLAIAKALVEGHDGEIGVRSQPGEGSTFYFTLNQWQRVQGSADVEWKGAQAA